MFIKTAGSTINVASNNTSCFVLFPELNIQVRSFKLSIELQNKELMKDMGSFMSPHYVCPNITIDFTNSSCIPMMVTIEVQRENVFSPSKVYYYYFAKDDGIMIQGTIKYKGSHYIHEGIFQL